jgi:hypothetical protein
MYINAKMIPVETIQELVEGRKKESNGESEFKDDVFGTL